MVSSPPRRIVAGLAAAVALVLGGQASAQDVLPQVSLDRPAEFAVFIDLDAASPDNMDATRQVIERVGGEEAGEGLDAQLADYNEQWQAVYDTGLRQVAILGAPEQEEVTVLLARSAGTDAQDLLEGLRGLAEMELGGDAPFDADDSEIHEIDDRWAYVTGANLVAPGDGEAADHSALNAALAQADGAAVRMAFVLGDQGKQMLAQARQDPNAMMIAGLLQPLDELTSGFVSVQLGEAPHLELSLDFADAAHAERFRQELEGLVQMMGAMLAMAAAEDPEADFDMQAMQQGLARLVPEINDTRVGKRIDEGLVNDLAAAGFLELGEMFAQPAGPGHDAHGW